MLLSSVCMFMCAGRHLLLHSCWFSNGLRGNDNSEYSGKSTVPTEHLTDVAIPVICDGVDGSGTTIAFEYLKDRFECALGQEFKTRAVISRTVNTLLAGGSKKTPEQDVSWASSPVRPALSRFDAGTVAAVAIDDILEAGKALRRQVKWKVRRFPDGSVRDAAIRSKSTHVDADVEDFHRSMRRGQLDDILNAQDSGQAVFCFEMTAHADILPVTKSPPAQPFRKNDPVALCKVIYNTAGFPQLEHLECQRLGHPSLAETQNVLQAIFEEDRSAATESCVGRDMNKFGSPVKVEISGIDHSLEVKVVLEVSLGTMAILTVSPGPDGTGRMRWEPRQIWERIEIGRVRRLSRVPEASAGHSSGTGRHQKVYHVLHSTNASGIGNLSRAVGEFFRRVGPSMPQKAELICIGKMQGGKAVMQEFREEAAFHGFEDAWHSTNEGACWGMSLSLLLNMVQNAGLAIPDDETAEKHLHKLRTAETLGKLHAPNLLHRSMQAWQPAWSEHQQRTKMTVRFLDEEKPKDRAIREEFRACEDVGSVDMSNAMVYGSIRYITNIVYD